MRAWLRILWVLAIWVVAFELKALGAPGQLGAPWVFAPVSTCNESVAVGGVFDGATVTVLLRGSDGRLRAVGEAVASWVTVVIRLDQLPPGGLQQGDQLMAKQKMGTEESAESPKPVEVQEFKVGYLNQLNFWTHPYVCSHCMAFDGLVPGGELEVRPSGSSGKAGALHGFAIARIEPGLGFEEELEVRQSACQQVGPVVAGPVAEPTPLDAHRRLAAPQIAKDMYACENVVPVNKVVEGALVTVSRQVGAVTVPFYSTGQDVKVSEPLKESETVSVMQAMPDCDIVDSPKTTRSVLPASAKPAPWVVGPLCAGSHLVTVGGLSVGSRFRVLQDGVEVSVCRASEEEWPCDVPSLKAEADITAQMELCGNWGPRSQAMPVEELPANIPQPEIAVDPLIACSVIVPVENVQPGAWVTAHSKNLGQISQATYAKGTEIRLKVAPALWAGDQVTVEELACLDTVVRSRTVNVQPAPALGYPQIVTPVYAGQSAVRVRNVVPGAQVQLYLNRKFAAAANTGMSDVTIDVGYPLSPNDRLNARQLLCNASTKLDPEQEITVKVPLPEQPTNLTPNQGTVSRRVIFRWTDPAGGGLQSAEQFLLNYKVDNHLIQRLTKPPQYDAGEQPYSAKVHWCVRGENKWGPGKEACVDFQIEEEPEPTGGGGAPTINGWSQVAISNCHNRTLHIWEKDFTAGTKKELGTIDPQWVGSSCPNGNPPFVVKLTDGHLYELDAVDPYNGNCGGINDPDHLIECKVWFWALPGDSEGPVAHANIK